MFIWMGFQKVRAIRFPDLQSTFDKMDAWCNGNCSIQSGCRIAGGKVPGASATGLQARLSAGHKKGGRSWAGRRICVKGAFLPGQCQPVQGGCFTVLRAGWGFGLAWPCLPAVDFQRACRGARAQRLQALAGANCFFQTGARGRAGWRRCGLGMAPDVGRMRWCKAPCLADLRGCRHAGLAPAAWQGGKGGKGGAPGRRQGMRGLRAQGPKRPSSHVPVQGVLFF